MASLGILGLWALMLRLVAFVSFVPSNFPVWALQAVMQGDTTVDLYVNGIYVREDKALPILPMNGIRRVTAAPGNLSLPKVMGSTARLSAGDLIAVKVYTSRVFLINVTDLLGKVRKYPAPAGFITAFSEGTMSSGAWKCKDQDMANNLVFQDPSFNDSLWEPAVVQARDCCPWRDPGGNWQNLNAHWIGIAFTRNSVNVSGPREFNCRYTVPKASNNSNNGRLPIEESYNSSGVPSAEDLLENYTRVTKVTMDRFSLEVLLDTKELMVPILNLSGIQATTSMSRFEFSVNRTAHVYCGMIDSRYQLRTPSHRELKSWGTPNLNAKGPSRLFEGIGPEYTTQELNATLMSRFTVGSVAECEALCRANTTCQAFTYYVLGTDLASGKNCKLFSEYDPTRPLLPAVSYAAFIHRKVYYADTMILLPIPGMLLPGTIYNGFCSTEDPVTGRHMDFDAVAATRITIRTEGCFDCGTTTPPEATLLGGYSSDSAIIANVQANRPGRIFCGAVKIAGIDRNNTVGLTIDQIKAQDFFNILIVGGSIASVTMTGLKRNTPYEVACVAEADGGATSNQSNVDLTRRQWYTANIPPNMASMKIEQSISDSKKSIAVLTQITEVGYLYCQVFETQVVIQQGVPDYLELAQVGIQQKVVDVSQDAATLFEKLDPNTSYDVYCTAVSNDFSNDTSSDDSLSPFPIARIVSTTVGYYSVQLTVSVSRGPASVFCQVFEWGLRPVTERPPAPNQIDMYSSPYHADITLPGGASLKLEIGPLATGMLYDLYCYAEELLPPAPKGFILPPRRGMTDDAVFRTRHFFGTKGPTFDSNGWECVSGHACSVSYVNSFQGKLTGQDKVMVRSDQCQELCVCLGTEDPDRKGGECSMISQDRIIVAGDGLSDRKDPLGAWCYVAPNTCPDGRTSSNFGYLTLSYKVCSYNATAGAATLPGFPNQGLATTVLRMNGTAFRIGNMPFVSPGFNYNLCWCNGTESRCKLQSDYRYRLGNLHMAGPTAKQAQAYSTCMVGLPCVIKYFGGHALSSGSRLIVLPEDPAGCFWKRMSPGDSPGIVGFPALGVSASFNSTSREYVWTDYNGSEQPVVVRGGTYNLCWCGPDPMGMDPAPGKDWRQPTGVQPDPCPYHRPDNAGMFVAPAGKLRIIGPVARATSYCKLGVECIVDQVEGVGISGSDRISIQTACGKASQPPPGWLAGVAELGTDQWVEGGWMARGPVLSSDVLLSIGAPQFRATTKTTTTTQTTSSTVFTTGSGLSSIKGCNDSNSSNGSNCFNSSNDSGTSTNAGSSASNVTITTSGNTSNATHLLSACNASNMSSNCSNAPNGSNAFNATFINAKTAQAGPKVLDLTTTAERVTTTTTKTTTTTTTMDYSLPFVSDTPRGVFGFPNSGVSVSDARVGYFSWGGPTWAQAGNYMLCWCGADATTEGCKEPSDFYMPVGLLTITGPSVLPLASQLHRCVRGRPCEVVRFEGTMPAVSKLLITFDECGTMAPVGAPRNGQSIASSDGYNFRWGEDPIMCTPGKYRLCWCPEISSCHQAYQFSSYAGVLQVKAPTQAPDFYFCALGLPCNVSGIYGEGLNNGDKVMALTACGTGEAPYEFLSGARSTATFLDGSVFELPPTREAGRFRVCWCAAETVCNTGSDFATDLGQIDTGGPDASVTYVCYEWEPCALNYLQGLALKDGDRIMAVPDGTDCTRHYLGAPPPLGQEGFPNGGVAAASTNGGRSHDWGKGLIRSFPGMYAVCWCSNSSVPGGCTETGPFNVPGGAMRIGTSEEFQYVTRPEDNKERPGDENLQYLIAAPIPFLLCGAIIFGIKKVSQRKSASEPEAPSLRRPAADKTLSVQQQKDKGKYDVSIVMDTRAKISHMLAKRKEQSGPKDVVLALYGVARHKKIAPDGERGKDLYGDGKLADTFMDSAGSTATSWTRGASPGSKDPVSPSSAHSLAALAFGRVGGAADDDESVAPPPPPRSVAWGAFDDPRILQLMDIEGDVDVPSYKSPSKSATSRQSSKSDRMSETPSFEMPPARRPRGGKG